MKKPPHVRVNSDAPVFWPESCGTASNDGMGSWALNNQSRRHWGDPVGNPGLMNRSQFFREKVLIRDSWQYHHTGHYDFCKMAFSRTPQTELNSSRKQSQ